MLSTCLVGGDHGPGLGHGHPQIAIPAQGTLVEEQIYRGNTGGGHRHVFSLLLPAQGDNYRLRCRQQSKVCHSRRDGHLAKRSSHRRNSRGRNSIDSAGDLDCLLLRVVHQAEETVARVARLPIAG